MPFVDLVHEREFTHIRQINGTAHGLGQTGPGGAANRGDIA